MTEATKIPQVVLEFLTEGNSIEDLAALYWEALPEDQKAQLEADATAQMAMIEASSTNLN